MRGESTHTMHSIESSADADADDDGWLSEPCEPPRIGDDDAATAGSRECALAEPIALIVDAVACPW